MTSGSRGWAKYYSTSGRLFFRIQNVGANQLLLDDVAYVNPPEGAETQRTQVQPGDVLLSVTADVGRTCVIPDGPGPGHINQHLTVLRVKNDLDPLFLSAFLASRGGQVQFDRLNREGVKAGLNFDDVRSVNILCPPLNVQRLFTAVHKRHRGAIDNIQHGRTLQDNLINSLVQRAFCGEL